MARTGDEEIVERTHPVLGGAERAEVAFDLASPQQRGEELDRLALALDGRCCSARRRRPPRRAAALGVHELADLRKRVAQAGHRNRRRQLLRACAEALFEHARILQVAEAKRALVAAPVFAIDDADRHPLAVRLQTDVDALGPRRSSPRGALRSGAQRAATDNVAQLRIECDDPAHEHAARSAVRRGVGRAACQRHDAVAQRIATGHAVLEGDAAAAHVVVVIIVFALVVVRQGQHRRRRQCHGGDPLLVKKPQQWVPAGKGLTREGRAGRYLPVGS
jgi:hypothetical protein